MAPAKNTPTPERLAMLEWVAHLGAVTAEALADHQHSSIPVARGRLLAAARQGFVIYRRPLTRRPALYALTRRGAALCDARGLDPCRITASNANHLIECARAAAALERCYPDHRIAGERELRRAERDCRHALASAPLGLTGPDGLPQLHRPDLVLWPDHAERQLPVAVEIELTVKSPQRLAGICTAWARCSCVAGVLYLAAPDVQQPLDRAIRRACAHERVVVLPLDALPSPQRHAGQQ